ncbi:MAG: GIY-YIG protein [Parcubacteria group bacterium Greene0714_36]|nr:MAG: GIY-YIG protein [Parcubacteria group bacterium Greene0714_36]
MLFMVYFMNQESGVYILQSVRNQRYYIGSTDNLARRINEHGRGIVYATRALRPLILKRFIPCSSLTDTRQSEYRLKRYKSRKILEKVLESGVFPWEYSEIKVGN